MALDKAGLVNLALSHVAGEYVQVKQISKNGSLFAGKRVAAHLATGKRIVQGHIQYDAGRLQVVTRGVK
jgi:hypothetical protein